MASPSSKTACCQPDMGPFRARPRHRRHEASITVTWREYIFVVRRSQVDPKLDLRFVGSLDGVVALCKSRCDVAGFHIPEGALGDEVSRKYRPWLKPRLQRLIHFVRRTQGLIVTPDNPKRISGLSDIAKIKARFINRQRGSGTRLALERLLEEKGIDKEEITGYYSEEFTHLAVAAAVAGGVADVGLGIEAAARKLNMAFIPLFAEDYYLLTGADTVEQPDFQNLLSVLSGDEFRGFVNSLPGYDGSKAGTVMMIGDALKPEGRPVAIAPFGRRRAAGFAFGRPRSIPSTCAALAGGSRAADPLPGW